MGRTIEAFGLSEPYRLFLNSDPSGPQDWDDTLISDLDESSDKEDPEKTLQDDLIKCKNEIQDKENLFQLAVVNAARGSLDSNEAQLQLERACMEREDFRSQLLRA